MLNLGNVLIIGDSYSTFEGYNPNGNLFWYNNGGHENTDVSKVSETWWHQLLSNTQSQLILNESYSGSTVCYTERPEIPNTSFIHRLNKIIKSNVFTKNQIDTIFVFGGTNDSWIDCPIGENDHLNFSKEKLKSTINGFCFLLFKLKEERPHSKIYAVLNCEIKDEIKKGYLSACDYYGIKPIVLKDVSLTSGHPNKLGMTQIYEQILENLE